MMNRARLASWRDIGGMIRSLTEVDLFAWSKDRLAGYKQPRAVEFRSPLPALRSDSSLTQAW
jgi:hypothetical protein